MFKASERILREKSKKSRQKELPSAALLLVDTQNLFCGVQREFGKEFRLDYVRLLELVRRRFRPSRLRQVAYASLSSDANGKISGFLKNSGFEIFTTDIDDRIPELMQGFDLLVLASGDRNFLPLYQQARNEGKRIEILSFRSVLNWDILRLVNGVSFLDEEVVFLPGTSRSGHVAQN